MEDNFFQTLGQVQDPSFMQPSAPMPQPAAPVEAPRERRSVLDVIGTLADGFARLGGSEPMYQPTLDAQTARQREAELYPIEKQSAELGNQKTQMDMRVKQQAVLGQMLAGTEQVYRRGGPDALAKAWPTVAQQLGMVGLPAEEVQRIGGALQTNPDEAFTLFKGMMGADVVPEYDYIDIIDESGKPVKMAVNRNDPNDRQVVGTAVQRQGSAAIREMVVDGVAGNYSIGNDGKPVFVGGIYESPRVGRGGGGGSNRPAGIGAIPAGYGLAKDAQGNVMMDTMPDGSVVPRLVALPGGKAAYTQSKDKEKEDRAQQAKEDSARNVLELLDVADSQVGLLSAGPAAVTSFIPGSPAKNLEETITTIKANAGFDKLQAMRDASPTGGTLGPVSDFENKLLQSVIASLDIKQSPAQLRANLARVRRVYDAIINEGPEAAQRAFDGGSKRMKFNPATGEIE